MIAESAFFCTLLWRVVESLPLVFAGFFCRNASFFCIDVYSNHIVSDLDFEAGIRNGQVHKIWWPRTHRSVLNKDLLFLVHNAVVSRLSHQQRAPIVVRCWICISSFRFGLPSTIYRRPKPRCIHQMFWLIEVAMSKLCYHGILTLSVHLDNHDVYWWPVPISTPRPPRSENTVSECVVPLLFTASQTKFAVVCGSAIEY